MFHISLNAGRSLPPGAHCIVQGIQWTSLALSRSSVVKTLLGWMDRSWPSVEGRPCERKRHERIRVFFLRKMWVRKGEDWLQSYMLVINLAAGSSTHCCHSLSWRHVTFLSYLRIISMNWWPNFITLPNCQALSTFAQDADTERDQS